jgi:hypothetical protein
MPDVKDVDATWLPVIGRSLAYLCLHTAQKSAPEDFSNLLDKVKFLTDLGLPDADAAYTTGSTPESVRVQKSKKKGVRRGRKK